MLINIMIVIIIVKVYYRVSCAKGASDIWSFAEGWHVFCPNKLLNKADMFDISPKDERASGGSPDSKFSRILNPKAKPLYVSLAFCFLTCYSGLPRKTSTYVLKISEKLSKLANFRGHYTKFPGGACSRTPRGWRGLLQKCSVSRFCPTCTHVNVL